MNGEEFAISPQAEPNNQDILERIIQWAKKLKVAKLPFWEKVVFEYTHAVPDNKAYLMDREQFDDGKYRVFLNVKWEAEIDRIRREHAEL